MKNVSVVGGLLLGSMLCPVQAQGLNLRIPDIATTAEGFAPQGWQVEVVQEGDLNGDNINDGAIVLKKDDYKEPDEDDDATYLKRILVLTFRHHGHLERTAVSDEAVLDSNEGGLYGDPFQELKIERGVVVIRHYGGSRDRWGSTERYRWQQNTWMVIGKTEMAGDTFYPTMKDETDTNLSTGLVVRTYMNVVDDVTGKKKPAKNGNYYELQAITTSAPQKVDGIIDAAEWQGYVVKLNTKQQVVKGTHLWKDATDLSANLNAVRQSKDIFLRAEVTDNQFSDGDAVRLVNATGQVIPPQESKMAKTDKGYVFEARYAIKNIGKPAGSDDPHYKESTDPTYILNDFLNRCRLAVRFFAAVEVVDVDGTEKRAVLSTKVPGSPYHSSIRVYQRGGTALANTLELPGCE